MNGFIIPVVLLISYEACMNVKLLLFGSGTVTFAVL